MKMSKITVIGAVAAVVLLINGCNTGDSSSSYTEVSTSDVLSTVEDDFIAGPFVAKGEQFVSELTEDGIRFVEDARMSFNIKMEVLASEYIFEPLYEGEARLFRIRSEWINRAGEIEESVNTEVRTVYGETVLVWYDQLRCVPERLFSLPTDLIPGDIGVLPELVCADGSVVVRNYRVFTDEVGILVEVKTERLVNDILTDITVIEYIIADGELVAVNSLTLTLDDIVMDAAAAQVALELLINEAIAQAIAEANARIHSAITGAELDLDNLEVEILENGASVQATVDAAIADAEMQIHAFIDAQTAQFEEDVNRL